MRLILYQQRWYWFQGYAKEIETIVDQNSEGCVVYLVMLPSLQPLLKGIQIVVNLCLKFLLVYLTCIWSSDLWLETVVSLSILHASKYFCTYCASTSHGCWQSNTLCSLIHCILIERSNLLWFLCLSHSLC